MKFVKAYCEKCGKTGEAGIPDDYEVDEIKTVCGDCISKLKAQGEKGSVSKSLTKDVGDAPSKHEIPRNPGSLVVRPIYGRHLRVIKEKKKDSEERGSSRPFVQKHKLEVSP